MATKAAEIDAGGKVLRVIMAESKDWCENNLGGTWVLEDTATTGPVRGMYHKTKNKFYSERPYPSWTQDDDLNWNPPVAMPTDEDKSYYWNETDGKWDELVITEE